MSKQTLGHLATRFGAVITNTIADGQRYTVTEERGTEVLLRGESYAVEIGLDDELNRQAFWDDVYACNPSFPVSGFTYPR